MSTVERIDSPETEWNLPLQSLDKSPPAAQEIDKVAQKAFIINYKQNADLSRTFFWGTLMFAFGAGGFFASKETGWALFCGIGTCLSVVYRYFRPLDPDNLASAAVNAIVKGDEDAAIAEIKHGANLDKLFSRTSEVPSNLFDIAIRNNRLKVVAYLTRLGCKLTEGPDLVPLTPKNDNLPLHKFLVAQGMPIDKKGMALSVHFAMLVHYELKEAKSFELVDARCKMIKFLKDQGQQCKFGTYPLFLLETPLTIEDAKNYQELMDKIEALPEEGEERKTALLELISFWKEKSQNFEQKAKA
jgi:hypothetical protein